VELKCDVLSLSTTVRTDLRQTKWKAGFDQWKTCTVIAVGKKRMKVSSAFHIHVLRCSKELGALLLFSNRLLDDDFER